MDGFASASVLSNSASFGTKDAKLIASKRFYFNGGLFAKRNFLGGGLFKGSAFVRGLISQFGIFLKG